MNYVYNSIGLLVVSGIINNTTNNQLPSVTYNYGNIGIINVLGLSGPDIAIDAIHREIPNTQLFFIYCATDHYIIFNLHKMEYGYMRSTQQLFVNDGKSLIFVVSDDISDATVIQIYAYAPDNTTYIWNGQVYDKNKIIYTLKQETVQGNPPVTIPADLYIDGIWKFQLYIETPKTKGYSAISEIRVYKTLGV